VALKPFAAGPAAAGSFACVGAAVGGIAAGWRAGRIGIRHIVVFGGVMLAAGLAFNLATSSVWRRWSLSSGRLAQALPWDDGLRRALWREPITVAGAQHGGEQPKRLGATSIG